MCCIFYGYMDICTIEGQHGGGQVLQDAHYRWNITTRSDFETRWKKWMLPKPIKLATDSFFRL